jgi:hypothetical protein
MFAFGKSFYAPHGANGEQVVAMEMKVFSILSESTTDSDSGRPPISTTA